MPDLVLIFAIVVPILVLLVIWRIQSKEKVEQDRIGIKLRRKKVLKVVEGGTEVKLLPFIDRMIYISTQQQEITLDKYLVIGSAGQSVEIKGVLIYRIVDPSKFIENIDYVDSTDYTSHINTLLRKKIHQLIKQDLWGISKIDLIKNEQRILKNLTDNIIYNLELTKEELEQFNLQFRVTN